VSSWYRRRRRARQKGVLYVVLIHPDLDEIELFLGVGLTYSMQHIVGRRYKYWILLVDREIQVT
jgi:hypothetical protein